LSETDDGRRHTRTVAQRLWARGTASLRRHLRPQVQSGRRDLAPWSKHRLQGCR
jgi:hypothetical protein